MLHFLGEDRKHRVHGIEIRFDRVVIPRHAAKLKVVGYRKRGEDLTTAVCVLPGTELAFSQEVAVPAAGFLPWSTKVTHKTAIFRQVNKDEPRAHHDALEFPDGMIVLLTMLCVGQGASVLQLPAKPQTPTEVEAQKRVAYTG